MNKILILLSLVVLASCAPKETPFGNLVKRLGVFYEVNSQTPFTGTSVSHHENGQLEFKCNYKDGEPEGLWETYLKNGQLSSKSCYKNGSPSGMFYCEK